MIVTQITDPHVAPEEERPFGVDTRARFLDSLELQKRENSSLLILTGDLCFRDGDKETYEWMKVHLDALNIPYRILAGNHDDSTVLASVFHYGHALHPTNELFYDEKISGFHLLYLDSGEGILSPLQWQWLGDKMKEEPTLKKVIFMHHPPLACGVPYMDAKYPFEQSEQFEQFIAINSYSLTVFCGHYHIEKTILHPGISICITPSPFFTVDDRCDDFQEVTARPCYRRIVFGKEEIQTAVFYR
nr:metallophosphoesterase [Saprospiraceae bacterium]